MIAGCDGIIVSLILRMVSILVLAERMRHKHLAKAIDDFGTGYASRSVLNAIAALAFEFGILHCA